MKRLLTIITVVFVFNTAIVSAQVVSSTKESKLPPEELEALNARLDQFLELQRSQKWAEMYEMLSTGASREEVIKRYKKNWRYFERLDQRKVFADEPWRMDLVQINGCATIVYDGGKEQFAAWLIGVKIDGVWKFTEIELSQQIGRPPEKCRD